MGIFRAFDITSVMQNAKYFMQIVAFIRYINEKVILQRMWHYSLDTWYYNSHLEECNQRLQLGDFFPEIIVSVWDNF